MDFESVYQRYFKDVFLFLRSISASEDLAEEITQETFAKALKAIDTFDGRKDIRAWLFTIARNTYYTHCKRQKIYVEEEIEKMPLVNQTSFTSKIVDEAVSYTHLDVYKRQIIDLLYWCLSFSSIRMVAP